MSIYTKEYFIEKFSNIPEKEIRTGALENKCALWHCGVRLVNENCTNSGYVPTPEALALIKLFGGEADSYSSKYPEYSVVYTINDIADNLGETPKERILNKLKSL